MNEADRNLLIEIRVDFPDGSFEVSTGYPVQRNLILTARHGLYPKGAPNDAPVKLRWFHQRGDLRRFVPIDRSGIVWVSEVLDAALIRCMFPDRLVDWRYLSPVRPFHRENWASEGFPKGADTAKGETDAFPVSGILHDAATTAERFHLELPENFKSPHDWGGISGAPVFVRGQIVGLIVTTPTQAEGRLKAVFSADLFGDADFRSHIGYDREAGRVAALQVAAAACLNDSPQACIFLGQALSCAESDSALLAEKIVGLPTPQAVIRTIKDAHARACAEKKPRAASTLRELALIALPARFDTSIVEAIRINMGDTQRSVFAPPVCTGIAAELAMAAVDGQPARFRDTPSNEEEPFPDLYGAYSLDHPPHCGMSDQVDDAYFKEAWDGHLINKFITAEHRRRFLKDNLLKTVARRLQVSEETKRTHYVLMLDTGTEADNRCWERRAGLVRRDCPSLVFLRLSNDGDRYESETTLLDPLCRLLAHSKEPTP